MAAAATARPRATAVVRDYGPICGLFVLVLLITRPDYFGDTSGYVQNILKFDRGGYPSSENPLWDFGHLYWRALGWVVFKLFGWITPYARTGEQALAATTTFVCLTIACAFVCVIAVHSITLRVSGRRWIANVVTMAFLCFYAFLNYDRTGSAYIAGLMFVVLSLWFTIRAVDQGAVDWRASVVPGILEGCAVLIWFPFILALPGLLAVVFFWREDPAKPVALSIGIAVFAGLATITGYGFAVLQLHITSLAALLAWVKSSSHGWSQSHRWLRLASGLPRSFLSMRDDGMMLKRYVVKDPYAHVTLPQLIVGHLWKLAAFYAFVAALVLALWRKADWRMLAILVTASAPILLFAVFIFETGSPERYLPIYPFLCVAMAYALGRVVEAKLPRAVILGFALLAPILNVTMLSRFVMGSATHSVSGRARSLHGKVSDQGVVALTTLEDPLYQFSGSFPFDPLNRQQTLPVYDVVEMANDRIVTWKRDFAQRALRAIDAGASVWVSKRFLADQPLPDWRWTEGDDRRIQWKDLPPVFRNFAYSDDTGGPDGFLKLQPSGRNIDMLHEYAAQTSTAK